MKQGLPPTPEGAEILQAGGRGGTGNVLYLFRNEKPPVVLKVYRTRRSRWNEFLKDFSERHLEGKRGATAAIRRATEKLATDLWSREGFDVVPRVEKSVPAGITPLALWLVYCAEPVLWDVLADRQRALEAKLSLIEALGRTLSRRHTRALELNEPLLVHEHGHIKHFFVRGERLIAFDLEHGFKPGYPVLKAVAREVTGIAYSLIRADKAAAEPFLRAFAAGYANKPLLKQAIAEVTRGGGLIGKIRRWNERKGAATFTKTRSMERLCELLKSGADQPARSEQLRNFP
jgi:hypothetical protein